MEIVDSFAQGKVEGLISRGLVATVVAEQNDLNSFQLLFPYDKTNNLGVSSLRNLKINVSYAVLDAIQHKKPQFWAKNIKVASFP